jgi:FixJ family two-component response regulator
MTDRRFIVVIDGDKSVSKGLERLLHTAHMDVESYESSHEFGLVVDGRKPDCLVVDIEPGITGIALRAQLVEMGRSIPLILTTTANGVEAAHFATHGVEVLYKPFNEQVLLEAIARAIQRRDA